MSSKVSVSKNIIGRDTHPVFTLEVCVLLELVSRLSLINKCSATCLCGCSLCRHSFDSRGHNLAQVVVYFSDAVVVRVADVHLNVSFVLVVQTRDT